MKRAMSFLLAMLLLLAMSTTAVAQETTDGFQYRIEKDGNVTITGYLGKNSDVSIPNEIEGKPVTEIGNGAFLRNEIIKHVSIPEGVIKIGSGAFVGCPNVMSVELPSTVMVIGEGMFHYCPSLQSINVPEGVKDIPAYAFAETRSLKGIIIPSSVQTIGDDAFKAAGLNSINLPDGLLKIGNIAFGGCQNLESIVIPNSVKEMGTHTFWISENLKSITLPSGLTKISNGMFGYCKMLEKVAIPKSVKTIPKFEYAFPDCYKVSIWGFKGSSAETYATKNNVPFVIVDPVKEVLLMFSGENVTKGKLSIDLGSIITSLQLSAQISPENPWPGVTWKSSDAKVASVDANGLVTGLKKGKTTITATAVDGSGKKATCEVAVTNLVKAINITGEDTVQAGKKTALQTTVLPETADSKKLEWTTSDKAIAAVDAKGAVTAKKISEAKTVTITATAKDGSGVSAEFVITVVP